MTDDTTGPDSGVTLGQTAGGGGAAGAVQDHDNPVAGVFDDIEPVPGVPKPDPILVADSVLRSFGGLVAVNVDHVEIQRGAITALIGPNGAGKTTFFNLLTRFDERDGGHVELDGESIDKVQPYQLAQRGMVRTFQLTKALSRMTVLENMKLGAQHQTGEKFWKALLPIWGRQDREIGERADVLLDRFNLTHMRDEFAGTMSGGQRKLVEMARALMTDPKLVMLDEPMAGVNPALTQSLLGHVKGLRAEGRTVIFVEHDMDVVRDISDWVVVMAEGVIIAEGTPDDIAADPAVIDAYLGSHHDTDLSEWDLDEDPADAVIEANLGDHHGAQHSEDAEQGDAESDDRSDGSS
jgi:branched-chain amino acid transport system ATP-binding protein